MPRRGATDLGVVVIEFSDRVVFTQDVVDCPDGGCDTPYVHRHLVDGTIQYAHRGFGIDPETGKAIMGPKIERK